MLQVFLLVLAVFIPIAVGYAMKRAAFMPDTFWAPAEKLTFYVLLPALVIDAVMSHSLTTAVLVYVNVRECWPP